MRMMFAVGIALISLAVNAAPTFAAIDGSGFVMRSSTVLVAPAHAAHTKATCPSGYKVVGGGVSWHAAKTRPDPANDTYVTASSPFNNRNAWYGAGRNASSASLDMSVNVLCLPATKIGSVTSFTKSVKVLNGAYLDATVACPSTAAVQGFFSPPYYAVGGGIYWVVPGTSTPVNGGFLSYLHPNSSFAGWIFAGINDTGRTLTAKMVTYCVPSSRVVVSSASSGAYMTSSPSTTEQYLTCSGGTHPLAGGAGWTAGAVDPVQTTDHVESLSPLRNGNGWYVSGRNNDSSFTGYFDYSLICLKF